MDELEQRAKEALSERRFNHSLCVRKRCGELAKIYGINVETAQKVGMVHDIAKEIPDEEKFEYIKNHNVEIDEIEKANTGLLHAKIGANIAKEEFGFNEEMVDAIKYHTTAKENMCMLTKILFVADATGEDRSWTDLEKVRKISETDIDKAIIYILELNIKKNIEQKKLIHPDSILARNYLYMQKIL